VKASGNILHFELSYFFIPPRTSENYICKEYSVAFFKNLSLSSLSDCEKMTEGFMPEGKIGRLDF
jgi:hypothetical protein